MTPAERQDRGDLAWTLVFCLAVVACCTGMVWAACTFEVPHAIRRTS